MKIKELIPTIFVLVVITWMLIWGNQKTDSVIWNSLEANASASEEHVNSLLNEPIVEDYSYDIKQLHFGDKIKAQIYSLTNRWKFPRKTFFTSYNPEIGQTDSSPCIGANGTSVCELARHGIRTIALSQDLVGHYGKKFIYGSKVRLYSDNPQCNGIFQIEDTMNKRYTNRGDIFCLNRTCNTSCYATLTAV